MREKLRTAVLAVLVHAKALNYWLGRQLWLTLRQIDEFGFADRLDALLAAKLTDDTRGQLGFQTIIAAVVVVITVMLTTIVLDKFDQSLGTPSNTDLANAQENATQGYADMVSLVAPLLLVAIAVVIIGLLRRVS